MNESLPVPAQADTSITLLREAMASGQDPQYLRELLAVRREWEADEARKAYFRAISEFQSRAPIIEKADDAHGKKYAKMDRIWADEARKRWEAYKVGKIPTVSYEEVIAKHKR